MINQHLYCRTPYPLLEKSRRNGGFLAFGAGNGIRTRDFQLGKLTLYQLSYARRKGK